MNETVEYLIKCVRMSLESLKKYGPCELQNMKCLFYIYSYTLFICYLLLDRFTAFCDVILLRNEPKYCLKEKLVIQLYMEKEAYNLWWNWWRVTTELFSSLLKL